MEQIGEGGFGLAFVAEQPAPVRRKATLKIIKPGMDGREIIARFEAERQALALMDHPHIAKVFDAGMTPPTERGYSGRPYSRDRRSIRAWPSGTDMPSMSIDQVWLA